MAPKNNLKARTKSKGNDIKALDYRKYSTNPAQFQTWVDVIFSKINLSIPSAAAVVGIVVFIIGLLFASTFDFGGEYIRTKAIYVGVFGISLVTSVVRYASLNIHSAFEHLRPCFLTDDNTYRLLLSRWFSKLSRNIRNTITIAIYGLLAILVAYSEFFLSPLTGRQSAGSIKAYFFDSFWYLPEHLWEKTIIIAFYGICVAFPLGIATSLLLNNYYFFKDLRKVPIIPLPEVIRARFRKVLDLYLRIVFTWSIGIGLFGLVFFAGLDAASIIFLSIMNFFGVMTLISIQLFYRSCLKQCASTKADLTLGSFQSTLGIRMRERELSGTSNIKLARAIELIQSQKAPTLVYEWADLFTIVASQVIVYGSALFGRLL